MQTLERYAAHLSRVAAPLRPRRSDFPFGEDPDAINFAYGLPDAASFPRRALAVATRRAMLEQAETALQYGRMEGTPELRSWIVEHQRQHDGATLEPEQVLITAGSMQAIGLVTQLLLDPGDVLVVEGPTFLGALSVFRLSGAELWSVPVDEQGMRVEQLVELLDTARRVGRRVKAIYVLPNFQNPSGATLSLERRERLLEVAGEHDLLVIEDDAYADLRYEGLNLPSLLARDREGRVLRLGTFSKILAAGMRLGWIAGPEELIGRLVELKVDGGTNPFAGHVAAAFARNGQLDRHIRRLLGIYRAKRDAMLRALDEYCGDYATWSRPQGGFFVWLRLEPDLNPTRLSEAAREEKVAYLSGRACFADGEEGERYLRLAFSYDSPDRLAEGVRRLGRAMARA